MRRSRFTKQLIGALGAIVIVSILVFGTLTTTQVQRDARKNIRDSLLTQALPLTQLLLPTLRRGELVSRETLAETTGGSGNRIDAGRCSWSALADNRTSPAAMDNHLGTTGD
ncbi:MAG: hypothetical protein U5O39_17300 [Gammaproteobacteria bacterium]|nr:hypothetical protein [Gammaproteobacteria bacterium]